MQNLITAIHVYRLACVYSVLIVPATHSFEENLNFSSDGLPQMFVREDPLGCDAVTCSKHKIAVLPATQNYLRQDLKKDHFILFVFSVMNNFHSYS